MENFELGTFLKKVRERQHLSSRQLAERTRRTGSDKGIAASHINKIENGRVRPTFQTLQKIAGALELPLVIVLDGGKANLDAVTILSTQEIAQSLPLALRREGVAQLLLMCKELTDEQVESILGVAHTIHNSIEPLNKTE